MEQGSLGSPSNSGRFNHIRSNAVTKYSRLTGASRSPLYFEQAAHEILTKIGEESGVSVPISLSKVADAFTVEARLRDSKTAAPEGCLSFDKELGRFIVYVKLQSAQSVLFLEGLSPRQRFTFMHEIAHRLFFVQEEKLWVRALEKVLSMSPSIYRTAIAGFLHRLEEKLCNEIAYRVLVPSGYIHEALSKTQYLNEAGLWQAALPDLIGSVANACQVSLEVSLLRILKAGRAKELHLPGSFILLIIELSPERPNGLKKVSLAFAPSSLDTTKIKSIYPGITPYHLGLAFNEFCSEVLTVNSVKDSSTINIPVKLVSRQKKGAKDRYIEAELDGYWRIFPGSNGNRRAMVWGCLKAIHP
jgi:hypothetical protein